MRAFEIGLVLPIMEVGPERTPARWTVIRDMALRAEALGFDTVWTPDELQWRVPGREPQGFWEGVSMAAAVAASTSTVKVGTWVLSALHRNAALSARAVETLDEISGGRFVFGLGAGHEWPGQAHAFGLPEDRIFARFDEALRVIVPLLRNGHADVEGTYHSARDLPNRPSGPRPNGIPLLIGGNGPKGQRHAALHADIYSCYVEERAHVDEVGPRIESLEAICVEVGRDPASIRRSVGAYVSPLEPVERQSTLSGPPEEIARALLTFRDAGFTQAELMVTQASVEAVEALAPVLELIDAELAALSTSRG